MAEYKHGAYGLIQTEGSRVADDSQSAIVYIGTAPVHTLALKTGESYPVNKPVIVYNMAEAQKYLGYSDDWANYTLCEAMYVHFQQKGVGPLALINVLDPATHKSNAKTTKSAAPVNGRVTIAEAQDAILETVTVNTSSDGQGSPTTLVKGTDYEISYDYAKSALVLRELRDGAFLASVTLEYNTVTPAAVTAQNVIGTTDNVGANTGLYAIRNVYQLTGRVPAYIAAPGWSSVKAVNDAMCEIAKKINGHWDAYVFADLPLTNGGTALTISTIATYKAGNGYDCENETVFWPMAEGTDGRKYHLSVLAAANFQELLTEYDGIPYHTASNTECSLIQNLYMGASAGNVVADVEIINNYLNKNGIASAAFVGGRWAIWGCHSADYNQEDADMLNVSETNRMMLYYVSNDFQNRRAGDVDRPITVNDLNSIAAEEQMRLDALVKIGALTYGEVAMNAELMERADVLKGDYSFTFNVTTAPLMKSLTAMVSWTEQGFVTYYESFVE